MKNPGSDIVCTLEYLLPSVDEVMTKLHSRTSEYTFNLLLPILFKVFNELLIKYLQFYYQSVDYPELQQNQKMFKGEYNAVLDYFIQEESKEGLNKKLAKDIAVKFERFVQLVGLSDTDLFEQFKNADSEERMIISRILYRRKGSDKSTANA